MGQIPTNKQFFSLNNLFYLQTSGSGCYTDISYDKTGIFLMKNNSKSCVDTKRKMKSEKRSRIGILEIGNSKSCVDNVPVNINPMIRVVFMVVGYSVDT